MYICWSKSECLHLHTYAFEAVYAYPTICLNTCSNIISTENLYNNVFSRNKFFLSLPVLFFIPYCKKIILNLYFIFYMKGMTQYLAIYMHYFINVDIPLPS